MGLTCFILVRETVDPEINSGRTHTHTNNISTSTQIVSGVQSADSQHRLAFVHFYFQRENKPLNIVRQSVLFDTHDSNVL